MLSEGIVWDLHLRYNSVGFFAPADFDVCIRFWNELLALVRNDRRHTAILDAWVATKPQQLRTQMPALSTCPVSFLCSILENITFTSIYCFEGLVAMASLWHAETSHPAPWVPKSEPTICSEPVCHNVSDIILNSLSPRFGELDPCTDWSERKCRPWRDNNDLLILTILMKSSVEASDLPMISRPIACTSTWRPNWKTNLLHSWTAFSFRLSLSMEHISKRTVS